MAEKKTAKSVKTTLTAASLREMPAIERAKLLTETRQDLLEAQVSLKANELANPRRIKELRRNVALILTVENEVAAANTTAQDRDGKED